VERAERARLGGAGQSAAQGVQTLVRDLNHLYRDTPALHRRDCDGAGFQWIEANAADASVYAWARFGGPEDRPVLAAFNFTPVPRPDFRLGVPAPGRWVERLNTDAAIYGGSGMGNLGGVESRAVAAQGRADSITVTLPPLGAVIFELEG